MEQYEELEMEILLKTLISDNSGTVGTLEIDGIFKCFTMEDQFNEPKVYGETRIPRGRYKIELRNEGSMTERYAKKYNFHRGMLWLRDVPDFSYVYIHIGNTEDHTDGCILVGSGCSIRNNAKNVSGSALSYTEIYPQIANAILSGEEVWIDVT